MWGAGWRGGGGAEHSHKQSEGLGGDLWVYKIGLRERERDRQTETERGRQTERQTDRDKERERESVCAGELIRNVNSFNVLLFWLFC